MVKLTAVMNQKSLEAPFGGIIGIPQVDVGAVRRRPARSMRRCRTSTTCGSTSRCPSSRSASIAIGMPVTRLDRGRRHRRSPARSPRSSRGSTRTAGSSPSAPRSTTPNDAHQPGPVPAGARRAARGAERHRAAADGAQLDALRRFGLRRAHRGRGRRRRSRGRAGLRQGRPPLARPRRDRRGPAARRRGGDRRARTG